MYLSYPEKMNNNAFLCGPIHVNAQFCWLLLKVKAFFCSIKSPTVAHMDVKVPSSNVALSGIVCYVFPSLM